MEEGEGFEEDVDEYASEGIFFVLVNARWNVIARAAHTQSIGIAIDNAMRSIEKENPRPKDILPKNFARPELDKRRLGDVVDLFTNIRMIEHGSEKDILGRTYEYCLPKFAEQEGKLAGEFYTPSCGGAHAGSGAPALPRPGLRPPLAVRDAFGGQRQLRPAGLHPHPGAVWCVVYFRRSNQILRGRNKREMYLRPICPGHHNTDFPSTPALIQRPGVFFLQKEDRACARSLLYGCL